FAGGYQDPTGLYHLAARYYDANIGRFTQPDPSGQEKNPYLYAEGDPVNRIDPTGLFSLDAALAGGVVGALALAAGTALGGPVIGGIVGGCAGAAVGEAVSGGDGGDVAAACAVGGILGGVGGGLTKFVPGP
ncbi:RHS repeat-associated core domain-containing protein, partial [Streptomyces sp. NPDC088915]|uniref:RHS repeat-associated core domain-containing protein n=1 Tax=Streptomyces sp. NPDC088915 TaxID=3365912 RepID=UPI00380957EE